MSKTPFSQTSWTWKVSRMLPVIFKPGTKFAHQNIFEDIFFIAKLIFWEMVQLDLLL